MDRIGVVKLKVLTLTRQRLKDGWVGGVGSGG
jgi:hypothetical protein